MNEILYNFSDLFWGAIGAASGVITILLVVLPNIKKYKNNEKINFVSIFIGVIYALVYIIFTVQKNKLIEMPKVVGNVYSNAIQTLNEYGINFTIENETNNPYDCVVKSQSIKEGEIISKKETIVILYLNNISGGSTDETQSEVTEVPTQNENSVSSETTTTNGDTTTTPDISTTVDGFSNATDCGLTTPETAPTVPTTPPETTTTVTEESTIEETQKFDPNYLFEIPNPEEVDLISGSLSGKYSGNSIYFTPSKSGYYGFVIKHNSPFQNSDAKLNIVNASGAYFSIEISDKTSYYLKKDTKYQIYLVEENSQIKGNELYYDYDVKMYNPSETYDIEGSFMGNLIFQGQYQKLYYKPLVSGEYVFKFKNYDELCYEFSCSKLDAEYPFKTKTIKKEHDKLTVNLKANEVYEITIRSNDILQGQYEVTIS